MPYVVKALVNSSADMGDVVMHIASCMSKKSNVTFVIKVSNIVFEGSDNLSFDAKILEFRGKYLEF